jgi:putative Mn2+ efflux pump MntP
MGIWEAVLMAVSLCADCFACTLCSGVTLRRLSWKTVSGIALAFAVIQSGLLLAGWAFGNVFVGLIEKISHWIGFLLLLYVGGGMLLEGIRALRGNGPAESVRLDGFRNVVLSGVATSIDALAVGITFAFLQVEIVPAVCLIGATTFVLSAIGVYVGSIFGAKYRSGAELVGGIVLILIGLRILLEHLGVI